MAWCEHNVGINGRDTRIIYAPCIRRDEEKCLPLLVEAVTRVILPAACAQPVVYVSVTDREIVGIEYSSCSAVVSLLDRLQ